MNRTAMPPPDARNGWLAWPIRWRRPTPLWVNASLLLSGAALAWQGQAWALPGVLLAALASRRTQTASDLGVEGANDHTPLEPMTAPAGDLPGKTRSVPAAARQTGRLGAEVMVAQVVPVWHRQLGLTRTATDDGLKDLLNAFTAMSGAVDALLQNLQYARGSATPGAVEGAVDNHSEAIATLLQPMQKAFDQRNAAVKVLADSADGLAELRQLTRQARETARHTRLVAFNASIEAQRSHSLDKGSQAVANEVRMLAGRIADISEQMERIVTQVQLPLQQARQEGEIHDTTHEELRLEAELHARTALGQMLDSLGAGLTGSAPVQQASSALKKELEEAFTHFQFGDRLAQMMDILGNDMTEFTRWVSQHPQATQDDATEWLTQLEAKYTMDEQRSQHHGNVHIDRGSVVEFF